MIYTPTGTKFQTLEIKLQPEDRAVDINDTYIARKLEINIFLARNAKRRKGPII